MLSFTEYAVPFITDPEDKAAEEAMRNIRALDGYVLGPPAIEGLFNHMKKALSIPSLKKNDAYLKECQEIAMRLTERINYYENPSNAGVVQKFVWGKPEPSVVTKLRVLSTEIINELASLQIKLSPNNSNYQQAGFKS